MIKQIILRKSYSKQLCLRLIGHSTVKTFDETLKGMDNKYNLISVIHRIVGTLLILCECSRIYPWYTCSVCAYSFTVVFFFACERIKQLKKVRK